MKTKRLVMTIEVGRRDSEIGPSSDDVGIVLSTMAQGYGGGVAGYGTVPPCVGYTWTTEDSPAVREQDATIAALDADNVALRDAVKMQLDAFAERDATIAKLEASVAQARKVIEGTVTALSVSADPQMVAVRALLIVALSVPS